MIQTVSLRPFTTEAWIRSQVSTCDICGGQRGTGTVFSPSMVYLAFLQRSMIIFVNMVLLPEGRVGEAMFFGNREAVD